MSLKKTIAYNTIIQLVGKIFSTLLGIAAIALMTRNLGAEKSGWFVTATGFLQFVAIMSDFGFVVTISNMLAEPKFQERAILNTVFTWRLITATVFQVIAPLIFLLFPYQWPIKLAVLITSWSFFATSLSGVFLGYFRTKLELTTVMISELLGRIMLVFGIALAIITNTGFIAMMISITVASFIATLYLAIRTGKIELKLTPAISRDMFNKMWPTALAIIFNAFYLQGDRVILPFYVSQTAVGIYGVAYRVLEVIAQIAGMIMGMLMPIITYAWSRNRYDDFKYHYQTAFDLLALLLLPMLTGIFVLAEPIMRFFGTEFANDGSILRWLSICIFGICFGMIFGHIALAINRQKQTLWVFFFDAILSIIGYFIFIPRYGLSGAIGVSVFSEFFAGFFLAVICFYYSKTSPRLLTFGKIVLASIIMGIFINAIQPLNLIISVIVGAIIFLALALAFQVISFATIKEITSFSQVAKE